MSEQSNNQENESESQEKDKISSENTQNLSKRQLKKLKKREEWLKLKPERRLKEKAKRKAKMESMKKEKQFECSYSQSRKKLKDSIMKNSNCKVNVVIDMSFHDLMHQRDLGKCCKQLLHCYSINRRLENPMQFHVTGLRDKGEQEMSKNSGYKNWDCNFHDNDYHQVFNKEKIIYLSSESDRVLEKLEDDKFYIIGGLVDHNHHKGLSHKLAVENGVSHARLPIDKYLELKTRKVLTIDHVFRIMASVSSGKTWKEAFLDTLPTRKGINVIEKVNPKDKEESQQPPKKAKLETHFNE